MTKATVTHSDGTTITGEYYVDPDDGDIYYVGGYMFGIHAEHVTLEIHKPELPTEKGSIILVSETKKGTYDPPLVAIHDGGTDTLPWSVSEGLNRAHDVSSTPYLFSRDLVQWTPAKVVPDE